MYLRPIKYIPVPVEQIGTRRVKFSTNRSFSPNSLVEMQWQFCRSQQSIRHRNFWTTHCRRAAINQRPERDALPNAMTQGAKA
uniref:Uncharacterized protein n=1 Tax=Trichogramma kaykai TaxID=54128 RepID=A0ABD2VXD3_9HYME